MPKKSTNFKNIANDLLSLPLKDSEDFYAMSGKKELSLGEAIVIAQIMRALDGDCRAFDVLKATVSPKDEARVKEKAGSEKRMYEQFIRGLSDSDG